jgi:hypothetical protein
MAIKRRRFLIWTGVGVIVVVVVVLLWMFQRTMRREFERVVDSHPAGYDDQPTTWSPVAPK